jgi:hypothetical protein
MSTTGDAIAAAVEKFVGYPYVYGATGPSSFDCSGLVKYVLTGLGVSNVPRTSEAQYAWATKISAADLQPGDLVFAQFSGDNASPGHVGIYTGNGKVLSAQDPAAGVGYDTLADWGNNIVGYGRVPGAAPGTNGGTSNAPSATLTGITIPGVGDIGAIADSLSGAVKDMDSIATVFVYLSSPGHWLRIGALFAGLALLGLAVWIMMGHPTPNVVPVPI